MHRTQIYLQDDLHEKLKALAYSGGISMSELIRRTLEKNVQKDPLANAQAFFTLLNPLDSFADVNAEQYARAIRSKSRILRAGDGL